ncbi:glycosyltransferase family 2 protein [Loigolactobacillus coryniformis]|nr:glycosyltransferase family 2 protein [Loigolactobacillus coryniformis]
MSVSCIVVTYNRIALLKECLTALIKQTVPIEHIIIVNNNSSDGTDQYIDNLDNDRILPINLERNIGGAAGFQLGLKKAFENYNDDFFWIMDDDTIPSVNALEALIASLKVIPKKFGFLCSNVRWTDGTPSNMPSPALNWPIYADKGLIEVTKATFVSILVNRQIVKELGLPIKEMFIWGDDTEYTTRLSENYTSYFVTNSIVTHKTPQTLNNITYLNDTVDRISRYFYLYRNLVFISKKYKSTGTSGLKVFIHGVFNATEALFKSKNNKIKRCFYILKGCFSGLQFNPAIEYPNQNNLKDGRPNK